MKVGEKIEIERLESGLYLIRWGDGTRLVGGAASTALAMNHAVFQTEAKEVSMATHLQGLG